MLTIIGVAVPVVLALYSLARLQQNRNSHGAHAPTGGAFQRKADYTPARFYNREKPNLPSPDFPATTLQSAEEKDAAARKYLVKWDNDDELEPASNVALLIASAPTSQDMVKKKLLSKQKQADVKWDAFEEK